jgi:hypothetical protein
MLARKARPAQEVQRSARADGPGEKIVRNGCLRRHAGASTKGVPAVSGLSDAGIAHFSMQISLAPKGTTA